MAWFEEEEYIKRYGHNKRDYNIPGVKEAIDKECEEIFKRTNERLEKEFKEKNEREARALGIEPGENEENMPYAKKYHGSAGDKLADFFIGNPWGMATSKFRKLCSCPHCDRNLYCEGVRKGEICHCGYCGKTFKFVHINIYPGRKY